MAEATFKKKKCPHCGVYVEYPSESEGVVAPCPSCGKPVILFSPRKRSSGVEKTAMWKQSSGFQGGGIQPHRKSGLPDTNALVPIAIGLAIGLVLLVLAGLSYGHWSEIGSGIGNGILGIGIFIVLAGIGLVIYFFPTYIAVKRSHKNTPAIFALNLLIGWTFVGWVISLVWALKND